MQYIATFRGVKGRWLVENESTPGGELRVPAPGDWRGASVGGQRIIGAPGSVAYLRQVERYGNRPDGRSGLMLSEMYRTFSSAELVTLRPAPRAEVPV